MKYRFGLLLNTWFATVLVLTLGVSAQAGLMGYWDFDGNVLDTSGNAKNGTVAGTEAYSPEHPSQVSGGSSFRFNGASSVRLPFLNFYGTASTTGATLSLWVQAGPQNDRRLFGEASSSGLSNGPFHGLGSANTTGNAGLRWYIRTNNGVTPLDRVGSQSVFDSSWHHVAWVDSPLGSTLYVDGVADPTGFSYTHSPSAVDTTTIGAVAFSGNTTFSALTGLIDDVAMWDTPLSPGAIRGLARGAYSPLTAPGRGSFVTEPFAGYTLGNIGGQTIRGTGFAPGAAWRTSNSTSCTIESNSLAYSSLPVTGGAYRCNGGGVAFADLDTTPGGEFGSQGFLDANGDIGADDTTLYMSWLFRGETGSSAGYAGVAFFQDSDSNERLFIGKLNENGQYSGTGGLGTFGAALDTETHLFVAKFTFKSGNDTIEVFLDPNLALPETLQTIDGKTTGIDLKFDRLRLSSGGGAWWWDELRFGDTWDSVVVPEPSAWALGSLGAVALLVVRRKKQAR